MDRMFCLPSHRRGIRLSRNFCTRRQKTVICGNRNTAGCTRLCLVIISIGNCARSYYTNYQYDTIPTSTAPDSVVPRTNCIHNNRVHVRCRYFSCTSCCTTICTTSTTDTDGTNARSAASSNISGTETSIAINWSTNTCSAIVRSTDTYCAVTLGIKTRIVSRIYCSNN